MVGFHSIGVKEQKQDITKQSIGLNVFPNPAHDSPTIAYSLTRTNDMQITIYDASGRQVRSLISSEVNSGSYSIVWDGCDDNCQAVRQGVYYVRLSANSESVQKKLILLK